MGAESMSATQQAIGPIQAIAPGRGMPNVLLADETETAFAAVMGRDPETRARRLVACWNACRDLSTEDLEELAGSGQVLVRADALGLPPPERDAWDAPECWERWTVSTITEDCHAGAGREA